MQPSILQEITEEISEGVLSGAVIACGNASREMEAIAVGHADFAHAMPMRTDSIFDMASCTKPICTISAVLLCRQQGLLDLDAPFNRYLPFGGHLPGRCPTLRELANHLSGFSHVGHDATPESRQYGSPYGWEVNANLLRFPPLYEPGVRYEYCCWNYMLLARVVEAVSGMPYTAFCRKNLFLPLDMADSQIGGAVTTATADRLTQSIGTKRPGVISDRWARRLLRDGFASGHAGLMTTAADLGKFCRTLLQGGSPLFTGETMDILTTPQKVDEHHSHSLGWLMQDELLPASASDKCIFHNGYSGQTVLIDFRKGFYGLVLTARHDLYERAKTGRFQILDILLRQFAN